MSKEQPNGRLSASVHLFCDQDSSLLSSVTIIPHSSDNEQEDRGKSENAHFEAVEIATACGLAMTVYEILFSLSPLCYLWLNSYSSVGA